MTSRPILAVARDLGLHEDDVLLYGRDKAKVELEAFNRPASGRGRLILVSAVNPTPAGEGKTTTSIGLAMGMQKLGKRAVLSLREPSLGPVFGIKGGGTGGGRASLVPTDDINLHFTGDIHAVTTAHNLLAALLDNALHFRDSFDGAPLDPKQITWGRVLDMNDRALRRVILGVGGKAHGVLREDRFDITAASEVMAILALATDQADLEKRLGNIVVGSTTAGHSVTAGDLGAAGAMSALLRDALRPNLVQTAEGGPAFVHAGPFGNVAHGCSSVLATRLAIRTGDYAITEAGFGFDLGGEKFLNVKCRQAGIWPRAVVLVATLRALKLHGGAPLPDVAKPNGAALDAGIAHLEHHLRSIARFGLGAVVAINVFPDDTPDELARVAKAAASHGVPCARSEGFARGGDGTIELARTVIEAVDATDTAPPAPRFLYASDDAPEVKIKAIAQSVYGARDVTFAPRAVQDLARIRKLGGEKAPICMAKTALSLSDDAARVGVPRDFDVAVREVRYASGAGMLVPLTGEIMTMPGLPKVPAARGVRLAGDGRIVGLMQEK